MFRSAAGLWATTAGLPELVLRDSVRVPRDSRRVRRDSIRVRRDSRSPLLRAVPVQRSTSRRGRRRLARHERDTTRRRVAQDDRDRSSRRSYRRNSAVLRYCSSSLVLPYILQAQQPCHIPELKNRRLWSCFLLQPNLINTRMSRRADIRDVTSLRRTFELVFGRTPRRAAGLSAGWCDAGVSPRSQA